MTCNMMDFFLEEQRKKYNIRAILMTISAGCNKVDYASGQSMSSVPAKCNMNYRIGGQGITILTTLFMILVDRCILSLDDVVSTYLPNVPNGNLITLKMLCNMTANLPDYIYEPSVLPILENDVYKQWTHQEILNIIYNLPILPEFTPPGNKFNFAHMTNTFLLGTIMEMKTRTNIKDLLQCYIFNPLCADDTEYQYTQTIQEPVLHAFSNFRITQTNYQSIPYFDPFEDSTYWNASWGWYATGINSNSRDVNKITRAIGTGKLLTCKGYRTQMGSQIPTPKGNDINYGLGVGIGGFGLNYLASPKYPYPVIWNSESFSGYKGIWVYIPSYDLSINMQMNTFDQDNDFNPYDVMQNLFNQYPLNTLLCITNLCNNYNSCQKCDPYYKCETVKKCKCKHC